MGNPLLLLRLEGPLQAWGARSRWDVRDTQPEPTKSGIIGLLGCALGYPRGDHRLETELDAGLRVGVRVEHPGRVIVDFQTVTDFLPTADGRYRHSGVKTGTSLQKLRADPEAEPATILSPRAYLEDAAFLVALAEAPGVAGLLVRCAHAVRHPVWPLYLGRKACCPTRPIFEDYTDDAYADLEDALRRHPWAWQGAACTLRDAPAGPLTVYLEHPDGTLARQDALRVNAARAYGFRRVTRLDVPCPAAVEGGMG